MPVAGGAMTVNILHNSYIHGVGDFPRQMSKLVPLLPSSPTSLPAFLIDASIKPEGTK